MSMQRYEIKPKHFQHLNSKLLYISTSKYQGDWKSIPHSHHFTELFYVVSGKGTFLLDGQIFFIGINDLIIVPPNIEHIEECLDASPLEYIVLGIEGITFFNTELSSSRIICNYSKKTELLNILNLIMEEVHHEPLGYTLVCQHLLDILLIQIIRCQKLVPASIGTAKMTRECGQVKQYLDSNYADNISLDSLAAFTHMNKYYLAHAFTKYTGLSPISYLNTKRLQVSRELLESTDHSIAEIATSIGFSSQSYFSQVFKKATGMTPNSYRKLKNREHKHAEQKKEEHNQSRLHKIKD